MMNVRMMGSLVTLGDAPEACAKIAEVPETKADGIFKACPPWVSMLLQLQDFGTSLWQLCDHAISVPRCLKGRVSCGRDAKDARDPFCIAGGVS
jgi:hypothetical protein